MGVAVLKNIYSDNEIVNNSMKWIKRVLEKNYHLKADVAEIAIRESGIIDVYSSNIEMSSHDSIEEWAKTVHEYYKKHLC